MFYYLVVLEILGLTAKNDEGQSPRMTGRTTY